jgi:hypothetical protein
MRLLAPLLLLASVGCDDPSDEGGFTDISAREDLPDAPIQAEVVTDQHRQVGVPAVDVLWVIDNSRSMFEEQQSLTNNFTSFMRFFEESEMDYHIGVVSTGWDSEEERGVLREADNIRGEPIRWIDTETREPERVFRDMALMGTDGPMEEKGRAQVYTALELDPTGENFGFLRSDAFLSVVVLSDEDDRSGDVPVSVDRFTDWLTELKGQPGKVSFSGIIPPAGGCGGLEEATEYVAVSRAVGGVQHPICDPAWDGVLQDLGEQAAGLRSEFTLSALPDPETLEVWMIEGRNDRTDFFQGFGFEYVRERNAIRFIEEIPPPESRIFIRYEVAQTGDPTD